MIIIETINNRIAQLLNTLGLTKTAFANNLKVSQAYISKLVRTGTPSDLLVDDICQKYNVNEKWLRTGEGEMFIIPEDETAALVSDLLEEPEDEFYQAIIELVRTYKQLSPESRSILREFGNMYLDNIKNRKA